ncbi:histidine kinase [Dokdonia sp.]|uniref:tetratricopeptide repeat-containing sensor histidine kinase n=1 Tax=Dokdonia sp. TaxID=2024995 RepID=UPI003266B9DE
MNYLKHTFSKPSICVVFALLSVFIFSCSQDTDLETQIQKNEIWSLILDIRKKNIPVPDKLRLYDSLYSVIEKKKEDTLKREHLRRLSIAYLVIDKQDTYFKINNEIKDLSLRTQDSLGLGHAYYNIARYYSVTGKLDSAYVYFYKSSKLYRKYSSDLNIGQVYLAMAIVQKNVGDLVGSEANTVNSIKYFEKIEDKRHLASAHNNLGIISKSLENYEEAIIEYKKVFELREKLKKNNILNAATLNNIGTIYSKLGEYSTAISYYKQGLRYDSLQYKRLRDHTGLSCNLTRARFFLGENANYPKLYKRFIQIHDSLQNIKGVILNQLSLARYYTKNKKNDSANYFVKKSLMVSKNISYNKGIVNSLELLTEIDEPKEALKYSKEYIRINDSLRKIEKRFQDQFARIRFGTEELEQENVKVNKQRAWLLNTVIGMGVLGILGYIVYYQRKLQHQYKASNLEQRLLRSQLNPHFLFNALNSVSGLVQKKSDQTIPYISRLGNLLRSILENSREEFITLAEELETITSYLELQSNFSKKFTFDIEIIGTLNKEELLIPPMFLQPFIENAIDHGFQGKDDEKITITIEQKLKDQVLYFIIEDNGIGYSNAIKSKEQAFGHQSLSGQILKERLDLYARAFKKKARYVIGDLATDGGTKVALWLPYLIED